jgi:hypothetical protein
MLEKVAYRRNSTSIKIPDLPSCLTPWRRAIFERLIIAQLLEEFPEFLNTECSLPCLKEPAPFPILSQMYPIHIYPTHLVDTILISSHRAVRH